MARTFNIYEGDNLIKSGLSPLELQQLTQDTTYNLKISANEEGRESDTVPIPQFKTLTTNLLKDFTPKTSTEYLLGEWQTTEKFEQGDVYMVELEGTKPFSQSFGFYVNTDVIGYFIPKNTGGNKYTMIFTMPKNIDSTTVKLYQYPSTSTGEVKLNDFKISKLNLENNLLSQSGKDKLPVDTNAYNVLDSSISKNWELGKRYYVRLKGTKPDSQNFTVYVDNGRTNKGNMSRIQGTDIYELTFTINQWDINRNVTNGLSFYQTPNGSDVGDVHIDEILILETNEAVLPTAIDIVPSTLNVKVGQAMTAQFKLTPPNAENYLTTFIGWLGGIASNSTADPERGLTIRGVKAGSFTATIRSQADPAVETQVTVNVTE